jgi:Chalcone isomerase-like
MKHLCLAILLCFACLAQAAGKPQWVDQNLPEAQLQGSGTLKFFGMRIYDAQLWTRPDFNSASFADHAMGLRLIYSRKLVGKLIAERSEEEIRKLGLGDDAKRKTWLAKMTGLFPDVNKGDTLSVLYRPGKPLVFKRNDVLLGEIDDLEFSRAFMAIWLDPKTSEPDLRKKLIAAKPG